jgi:error-prone DNA polymerase
MTWCELHAHSYHSLLDGASSPEGLARRAAGLGYPALALTDHDSLGGIVAHAQACAAVGITPIAGVELTLDDRSHLTLLARDATGYRSLCRLVSGAQLRGEKGTPVADLADVASAVEGVECLSGCRKGRTARALGRGDHRAAQAALRDLVDTFGQQHTWVEIQMAGMVDDRPLAHGLHRLARQADVGLVATGNSHYAAAGERRVQDVLVCIRERLPLAQARPHLRSGAAWQLRSPAQMARRYAELPEALAGVAALVERCRFDLQAVDARLPIFPAPTGRDSMTFLRTLTGAGAAERYGGRAASSAVQERLGHELTVIAALGMADYFLIVWDIVRYARGLGMLCQARGSSVGSMVCYCLGISAVEPLAHHLSFERFMALGRADPPDIDLDLPSDRDDGRPAREAVIQYALTRYADHAALVSTQITFRARSAIREVGMALGLDRDTLDALAGEQEGFARARSIRMTPGGPVAGLVADLCAQLDGIPRHLGQHPGGIVVTRRPLAEVAPIEHARMADRRVIQWDKDAAEGAGLAKIDLLGLGMLAVIEGCFAQIEEHTGQHLELHGFRCDDPAVYDAFCAADTVGVFQLESRAQMNACLPRLQPRSLADLAVAVALIRPGPLQANATNPYLRRRQGTEAVTYPGGSAGRQLLEPILGDTLGVCIFQDQVLETGRACGLSPEEAAALRRAISSARSSARLAALRRRMEEGLTVQGIDEAGRTEILAMVQAFSGYGFVRGHSVAFGYLAYVSCWLKIYYPALFAGALLDAQPMGFYPADLVVQDAERHGVEVLTVDVRYSREHCTVEGDGLRLGLRQVRGLSADACTRIVNAMAEKPATLEELCLAAALSPEEARALARAGALQSFEPVRRQALWQSPITAQTARGGWMPGVLQAVDPPVVWPAPSVLEELGLDRWATGVTPGRHLLSHLRVQLETYGAVTAATLQRLSSDTAICLAGQLVVRQRPPTARGLVFLSVSDETGMANVVLGPVVYERDRAVVRGEALLWVEGIVERRHGVAAIRAERVFALRTVLKRGAHSVTG